MEELWSAGASIWSGSNFNKNDGVAVLINNPNILVKGSTVVSPPRWFLGKLERAVFYFLWGSKWERLKRETIKKRPENGGKGLPDPHLFLGSRFTALHISYATTPSKENKTAAMARFWMGSYLRTLKILPVDLKTPVSFNLPKEYSFIKKFLKKYLLESEDVTILTQHKSLISVPLRAGGASTMSAARAGMRRHHSVRFIFKEVDGKLLDFALFEASQSRC
ncbi:uncharacterized protein LOC127944298 [Carassius gibelio]|uniref:uncharacterized protein LOC127944298 n=1 Tax=Carassius gibelio TaxID=101364 RepID=UPI0022787909|nr:uncharacterized protein LOC127944298 [Carassius gibelio]